MLGPGDWRQRLATITEMMREMSLQDDPQSMVRTYGARMRTIMPSDRWLSLSRRGLESPALPDHAVQHLDRGHQSMEAKGPAAAAGGGAARRADLWRRAPDHR